ncbi:MAG: S8 family serine peptidase, partial [Candidatus Peregrinibacteria bacterium]|nr:S8 family serine peptidase [Candidatus Peregrinibacteria bacterium]
MKKSLFTFGCAVIVGLITSLSFVDANPNPGSDELNYVEGEVIIKFKKSKQNVSSTEGLSFASSFSDALHLTKKETLGNTNSMVFKTNLYDLETLIDVFNDADYIEYAQKNYIYHTASVPNDTYISNLWGLHNTGQEYFTGTGGVVDADIDAAEGWNILTSGSGVVVAVVDTGANLAHTELDGNLWTNSGETADGSDSDGNGYIDDVYGWNFVGSGATVDSGSHGTHVAGIIGAEGGNNSGITGIAQEVELMVLQAGDASTGIFTTADIVEAFQYAAANGANIVNASFTNETFDQSMKDAIDAMPGVLVVAAASNESVDNDTTPMYPASYASSNIISVAATDPYDNLASFSNYGATSVDVAAPGKMIYSTYADGTDYQWLSGTSQSAPVVTGMAALALAKDPTLTPSEIRTALINTSDAKAALNGKCVANGRVNLYNLLNSLETTPNVFPTQVTNLVATAGDTEIALTWTGSSDSDGTVTGYDIVYGTESELYTILIQGGTSTSYTITGLTNGTTYYVGVKAVDSDGVNSTSYSTEASATPVATSNVAPDTVTGLVATAGDAQVALTWDTGTDSDGTISGYYVSYGTTSGSYGTTSALITGTSTTITGLTNGTTYYFAVKAVDNDSSTSTNFSTEASATPVATSNVAPDTVTGLVATAGDAQVALTWDTGTDSDGTISGYYVSYGTTSGSYGTTSSLITGTSTTITGLTNGTTYYFAVKAVDNDSATSTNFSTEASATPSETFSVNNGFTVTDFLSASDQDVVSVTPIISGKIGGSFSLTNVEIGATVSGTINGSNQGFTGFGTDSGYSINPSTRVFSVDLVELVKETISTFTA